MTRALFLDRDGVINVDYGHVYKKSEFDFVPGIFDFVKKYYQMGYIIIVVSNQAGVAKGLYTKDDLAIIDDYMKKQFLANGIEIKDSFYCIHHPDENCDCRKPKPGLFNLAKEKYDIKMDESIMIGDKMSDLEAAHLAGVKSLVFFKGKYPAMNAPFKYKVITSLKNS